MLLDLRLALRRLLARPTTTLVAITALGLGVGANTAVFTVLNTVILEPLPLDRPERLVRVREIRSSDPTVAREASFPDLEDWRRELQEIEDLAAFATSSGGLPVKLAEDRPREYIGGYLVTGNWFDVLGVRPLRGRLFGLEDDRPGAERVVVIGEALWRRRFAAAEDNVLGRRLDIAGRTYAIVGVVPGGVDLPLGAELWLPLQTTVSPGFLEDRGVGFLNPIARVPQGISLAAAQSELDSIIARTTNLYRQSDDHSASLLTPLADELTGPIRSPLFALLAISALVLILACANVASLRTVTQIARRRELSVELAMGAGWARLLRRNAIESLILGVTGAILGVAAGELALRTLLRLSPTPLFRGDQLGVDGLVITFAVTAGTTAAVVAGGVPLIHHLIGDRSIRLTSSARAGSARGERRALRATVLAQAALATVLLLLAAVTLQTLRGLLAHDPGFEHESLVSVMVPLPSSYQEDVGRSHAFFAELIERVEAMPATVSAAAVLVRPLEGSEGYDAPWSAASLDLDENRRNPLANYEAVTPAYFRTLGIPLLAGRVFDPGDREETQPVAVVSAAMAARYWPDGAIGEQLKLARPEIEAPWLEIVGVVGNVDHRGLGVQRHDIYVPQLQSPWKLNHFAVRVRGDAAAVLPELRSHIAAIDPTVEPLDALTGAQLMGRHVAAERFRNALVNLFAVLALVLAAIGTYGVVAFLLAASRRELGIRAALGAAPRQLHGEALRRHLAPVVLGTALGLGVGWWLSATTLPQTLGTEALRPLDATLVTLLLLAVSLAACYLPTRRASRAEPFASLGEE